MKIYVNASALREGNGTEASPFKHINDAAQLARPGDEVLVAPGVYREYVNPASGGTEDAPIVYKSIVPLGAHITGAEVLKGWRRYKGSVWIARVPSGVFGGYNPYTTPVEGDWYYSSAPQHTGAVYLNDSMLYETATLDECIKAEIYMPSWNQAFSVYKWYCEQDGDETVLYANFHDFDPNLENVEINVRRRCFFPQMTGLDYITLSGFMVSKAATTWAPPSAFQDGMIGPHWSKGWIIEDCDISNSKCCGISLGKYYDPENDNYYTINRIKGSTQMEHDTICRGLYHGWSKERIGSHTVRRCNIHHCEQAGIAGHMGCAFSVIEDNHIHHINNMQQLNGAEISGIKLHAAIDVLIRRNHIHHSTMGVWCDWQAQGTRIAQNLLHDNHMPEGATFAEGAMLNQDIFVEVSHGPTLIDNNILLSKAAVRLATQGVACVHNLMLGSFTSVGVGADGMINGKNQPRYTPYHIRHRTELAGYMTILHGDDRFFNNIFVQGWQPQAHEAYEDSDCDPLYNDVVGTAVFDDYPTYEEWLLRFELGKPTDVNKLNSYHHDNLPVWVGGNAYLGGARACKHETDKLVNDKDEAYVHLYERDGKYTLDTNIYELVKDFRCGIITSDTLGKAFEPAQRFENPDGSDIVFDRDFFSIHRGLTALPGPFTNAYDAQNALL